MPLLLAQHTLLKQHNCMFCPLHTGLVRAPPSPCGSTARLQPVHQQQFLHNLQFHKLLNPMLVFLSTPSVPASRATKKRSHRRRRPPTRTRGRSATTSIPFEATRQHKAMPEMWPHACWPSRVSLSREANHGARRGTRIFKQSGTSLKQTIFPQAQKFEQTKHHIFLAFDALIGAPLRCIKN